MRARRTAVACAALALTLGLTACGDADDQDASPTTRTSEARTVTDTPADTPTDTPGDFSGTWVDPDGRGYLSFDGDGGITGSDACNGITTTYSVDGTTATVEPFPTTMMACGGRLVAVAARRQHRRTGRQLAHRPGAGRRGARHTGSRRRAGVTPE